MADYIIIANFFFSNIVFSVFTILLYAQGLLADIPKENEDKGVIVFRFVSKSVTALFYNFSNFRRAYLVTGYQNSNDGDPIHLPGIEEPLYVLLKAKGRKFDSLKHAIYILTKDDKYAPFRIKIEFWEKLAALIENNQAYKDNVIYLYNKYCPKGKKIL